MCPVEVRSAVSTPPYPRGEEPDFVDDTRVSSHSGECFPEGSRSQMFDQN